MEMLIKMMFVVDTIVLPSCVAVVNLLYNFL